MEQREIAIGLDIGTTKIVAIVGHKNEYGKMEILGFGKAKSLEYSVALFLISRKLSNQFVML